MDGDAGDPEDQEALAAAFRRVETRRDLAELLQIPYPRLTRIIYRDRPERFYTTWEISKRSGGTRTIKAARPPLSDIQKTLCRILTAVYEPKAAAHGYVPSRSVVTNAENHVRKRFVFNVDLQEFFPTINFGRVRGLFLARPFSCTSEVASLLAAICCADNALPIGAPTSPVVSNMICLRLDAELQRLARANGCWYTRYADDITFSSNRNAFPHALATPIGPRSAVRAGNALREVIESNGFVVNAAKVRLQNTGTRQEVTGVIVNQKLNVRRRYVRQIRAMLHAWDRYGLALAQERMPSWYRKDRYPGATPDFAGVVRGKISYLSMIRGSDDAIVERFRREYARLEAGQSLVVVKEQPAASPAGQPEEGTAQEVVRVLHLSDIHFDEATSWDANSMLSELCKTIAEDLPTPDIVAITGDIGSTGVEENYELATPWILESLLPAAGVELNRLLVVPGNHDVNRGRVSEMAKTFQSDLFNLPFSARGDKIQSVLADPESRDLLLRRFEAYREFAKATEQPYDHAPWWVRSLEIGGLDVRVLGLCTSWCSYQKEEKGKLFVGLPQVTALLGDDASDGGDLHIAMMHHPFDYQPEGDRAARSRIQQWANVIMRGHLHEEDAYATTPRSGGTFVTVAAGATYQGSEFPNGFHLVELHVDGLCEITPYLWSSDEPSWYRSRDVFREGPDQIGRFEFTPLK